jgi:hypothetical protein
MIVPKLRVSNTTNVLVILLLNNFICIPYINFSCNLILKLTPIFYSPSDNGIPETDKHSTLIIVT